MIMSTFYTIHITTVTTDVDVDTLTVLAPTAEQALNEALNKYGSDYIYDIDYTTNGSNNVTEVCG